MATTVRVVADLLTAYLTPVPIPERWRESRHLAGGTRLTVLAEGHPVDVVLLGSSPRRVLLAHGWAGRPSQLGPLAGALVDAGFGVVLPSLPGHGTSPPWDPRGTANFGQFASALAATAVAVGGVEAIVGHSGGALAGVMAMAGVTADPVTALRFVGLAMLGRLRDSVDRHVARTGGNTAAFDAAMVARFGDDVFARTDAVALAPSLTATRALLVHDIDDQHVPLAEASAVAAAWPGTRLSTTRRYGHHLLLRRPDVLAEVIGFFDA